MLVLLNVDSCPVFSVDGFGIRQCLDVPHVPPRSNFSHLPLSTSSTARPHSYQRLKHFYKVRSARQKNNWKQSWCISCSHQSYWINHCHLAPRQPRTSLSAAPSACGPQECWVMRDGKGHPGIRLPALLGRKERSVMWGCVCLFTLTCEVFSSCFHP